MYFLSMTMFMLLIAVQVIEWRRLRDLLPAGLCTCAVSSLHLALVGGDLPFQYADTAPLSNHVAISLLLQVTVAPIAGIWYAQGIERGAPFPWQRTLLFTCMALAWESMMRSADRLTTMGWWTIQMSFLYYWLIYSVCYGCYRLYHRQRWQRAVVPESR